MSANISALVLLSLITSPDGWHLSEGSMAYFGVGLVIGAAIATYTIQAFTTLIPTGLLGLVIFLAALTTALGLMALLRPRKAVSTDVVAAAAKLSA
jgi:hypothetical protein